MKFYIVLVILAFSVQVIAQEDEQSIMFNLTVNNEPLKMGETLYLPAIKDSIYFENIRFYISNLQVFQDEQLMASSEKKHLLVDAENPESLKVLLNANLNFNKIKFNIGIDSLTNVSGAFGGDLDPTNNMYWTWQSGYINFKLEGKTAVCPARNNRFQFHVGGYQSPFNTLRQVELSISDHRQITINVAIDKLLSQINLEETYQVMSPNAQAVEMAELLPSIFSISK